MENSACFTIMLKSCTTYWRLARPEAGGVGGYKGVTRALPSPSPIPRPISFLFIYILTHHWPYEFNKPPWPYHGLSDCFFF